jgi:hypothetical protein
MELKGNNSQRLRMPEEKKTLKKKGIKEEILESTINPLFSLSKETLKVIQALEHFHSTGEIKKELLKGFDQNGKWRGVWKSECIDEWTDKIKKHQLPLSSTIKNDRLGKKHLLTSYYIEEKSPCTRKIEIEYLSIAGVLVAPKTREFSAPNLTHVGGKIDLPHCKKFQLSNLKIVEGFLALNSCPSPSLPNLEKVKGTLDVYYAIDLHAPKLKEIEYIKFQNLALPKREKLIKQLSTTSLKTLEKTIYDLGTSQGVKKELDKRKLKEKIKGLENGEVQEIEI